MALPASVSAAPLATAMAPSPYQPAAPRRCAPGCSVKALAVKRLDSVSAAWSEKTLMMLSLASTAPANFSWMSSAECSLRETLPW